MKKIVSFVLLGLLSSSVYAGHFNVFNSFPLTSADAGAKLYDDCLYYFTGDTLRITNNERGGNALQVAMLSTAYLYVEKGQVLELQGGPGSGILPGGAGIYVPQSSTLYLLGGGTIISRGGEAGQGSQGMIGLPGLIIPGQKLYMGGIGGYGGSGGGGAGAGIGTDGGLGGLGGLPSISWPKCSGEIDGGKTGYDGFFSLSSAQGGSVYIVGTLTVTAVGGKSSTTQKEPSTGCLSFKLNHYWVWDMGSDEVAGGGGAGGNGNNGLEGMNFGGGGAGAAGAGGGGSGGVATVRDLDFKYLMQKGKIFFTGATIDALVLFLTKNPFAWQLLETPLVKALLQYISGGKISQMLDMLLHANSHPYQFNGGGGEGSFSEDCIAPKVDGIGFWYGDMKFTDGNKNPQHVYFAQGGKMGAFGTSFPLLDLKRSPLAIANQKMDVFTTYPQELIDALTFDLTFDSTNVDTSKPHAKDTSIVFSDTLPERVPVPAAIEEALFLGYADEEGTYWYDQKGQVIHNAQDTLGRAIAVYLTAGDAELEPRWAAYSYVRVNHWVESTGPSTWTNDMEYSIKFTESFKGLEGNLFIAQAKTIPNFIPVKGSDTITLQEGDTNVIDLYYTRLQPTLAWSIPAYAQILDSAQDYTPAGKVRYGSRIKAPQWAVDKASGGYYRIKKWHEEGDPQRLFVDTMPNHSVTYVPELDSVPAAITVLNNDSLGTIMKMPKWLGTNIDIEVQVKKGYELDSSYVFFTSTYGHEYTPVTQTADGRLTLYATPEVDSALLWVRYRGVKHQMAYSESTSTRIATMTWFVNNDSIGNDEGISGNHEARTGDRVWVRPEPCTVGSNVCKSIVVTTLSGDTLAATFEENYNADNHYDMHFSFIMPDEDVKVVSYYGTLSDELTKLRVVCDTGEVKVYSTRGRLLKRDILLKDGYKVDAGQLVWIEIENDSTLPGLDSVRLRYYDGSRCSYEAIAPLLYVKTMQPLDQPVDTTIAATIFPKLMFRIPSLLKEVTVEIHHAGTDLAWEDDPTAIEERKETQIEDKAIYDVYGRYWGTQIENLPAGIYLRGGKKMIVH